MSHPHPRPTDPVVFRVEPLEARRLLSAYYVSPSGDDANPGTIDLPWRTVAKVNASQFGPGDRVLFEGGQRFAGGLSFDASDGGTPDAPVVISSYGVGRATLAPAAGADAIFLYNTGGFDISDLNLVGPGGAASSNTGNGIDVYGDAPGGERLAHVYVDGVDVGGFGGTGIVVGGPAGAAGYQDVRITNAVVHDNGRAGIATYGGQPPGPYMLRDVYVGHCRVYGNTGIAGAAGHTGDGIVLGSVDGATIERCVAHDNGSVGDGAIGIWTYDSNAVTIQFNESYDNRTSGTRDGGGFGLDGGVTGSVLQYNYSHGNDGSGYGLFEYVGAPPWSANTVRYNVSENDGRANGYAGIHAWDGGGGAAAGGGLRDAQVYNNTVYVAPAAASGVPRGIYVQSPTTDVRFRNNAVYAAGGVPVIDVAGGQVGMLFQGNAYWSAGAPLELRWAGVAYATLDAWRGATGQERLNSAPTGLVADPRFVSPGGGGTVGDPDRLGSVLAYRPRLGSPLIDAGLDLSARFGIDAGARDFGGAPLPQAGGYEVGAWERPFLPGDANRDGWVNFSDLALLAQNYNKAGKTWTQGDFNRDGVVNFSDLALLAQRYNTALPDPASVTESVPRDEVSPEPVFSTTRVDRPAAHARSGSPPVLSPKRLAATPKRWSIST